MHESYFKWGISVRYCITAGMCSTWPEVLASQVTWARVTHSRERCQTQLYLGIWAPESVILWLIFIVSSILTQIPASWWSPCLTGHTHLKQQLRLGSALITNTKQGTETTGMIRNTKYVNSKPAPQIPRTIRLDFLGFLYIKSHVRLINCPLTSGSFR